MFWGFCDFCFVWVVDFLFVCFSDYKLPMVFFQAMTKIHWSKHHERQMCRCKHFIRSVTPQPIATPLLTPDPLSTVRTGQEERARALWKLLHRETSSEEDSEIYSLSESLFINPHD